VSLAERWANLIPTAPIDRMTAAGDDLITRWSEPHRRYHTLEHLTRMLDVVDVSATDADDVTAVRLACWFHDAIYDPARSDNEDRSAALASLTLGALNVPSDEVVRLVRLTATHDVAPGDRNGSVIADADLAILATERAVYASYARQVRDEYAFVPDADFARGRSAILRRFLERPAIYRLPTHLESWEQRARANVMAEIDALDAASRNG
jgi:predicted metal-dependent HD superfamily phosphohydrolase